MILPYKVYTGITAGELRNKLKGVSNDTPVFVLLDKSDDNYDEDGNVRIVHPVEFVEREIRYVETSMGYEKDSNLVLHLSEDFYDTYDCVYNPKQ